jgi:hypothetical protein
MMKRNLFFLSSLALLATVSSCVNEDYDLNKIKIDEISGLEGIALPIGSSKKISVDEALSLDTEDGLIGIDPDGNLYVSISDPELMNESFVVPDFKFDGYDDDNPHQFTINNYVTIPSLSTNPDLVLEVPFTDLVYDIEIDQKDIPEIVGGIHYADVTSDLYVKFEYDQSQFPFNSVRIAEGTTIEFPQWIVLGEVQAGFQKINSYTIKFSSDVAITPKGSFIDFPLDAIDFTKMPDGQGLIGGGHLFLDAEVHLKGNIIIRAADCTASGQFKPIITTYLHMDPMIVESVRLSDVNLGDLADISKDFELSGMLPELLYGENVVCDFNDLRLKLMISNGLPFSGTVNTMIDSYRHGADSPLRQYDIDFRFNMDPSAKTVEKLYTESGKDSSEIIEGFNSILNPAPEYMTIRANVDIDSLDDVKNADDKYGVVVPGSTYAVKCGYEFIAPLSFGPDFLFALDQDITGLGLEISDVNVAEAQLKLNVVNALPFDLELSGQAIDADGNILPHINIQLDGAIKGGTAQSPALNPVILKLTNSGELKLDGVRLYMRASSAQENVAINRNQYVQLTDISLSLPAGISYKVNNN